MTDGPAPLAAPLAAALADRYRLERELGQGGMATVYLARDLRHERQVAIKVLRPELAAVIGAERFLREIKTIATLQHPHILGLIDSGEVQGTAYYVMPYVEGESLRDRLSREKQLPIAEAVRLATQVAGALDYAHRHGIIHRDIKPENVLLHDGSALVADFGIALAVSKTGGTRMTETGMSLGTPHYMSPEQAMGEREITARSDVYALGAMTYEMLAGEPPFTGPTAQAIIARVMTGEPPSLVAQRKSVPEAVEAAVFTALEKLPADRFATAAEFAAALAGDGVATRRLGGTNARPSRRVPGSPSRRGLVIAGLVALVTLAAGYLAGRRGAAATGPSVYDLALPDSARLSFSLVNVSSAYGTPLRNLSVAASGDFLVYAALHGDSTELWVRSLRDASTRPITGTIGATAPRLSPDGTRVAYFDGVGVMVTPLAGGEARRLLEVQGASALEWLGRDTLLVLHDDGTALARVDLQAGVVRNAAIVRCPLGTWVPTTREFLCSWNLSFFLVDPATGARREIRLAAEQGVAARGTDPRIVQDRYLIYLNADGDLAGAPFDLKTARMGRPATLLAGIRREAVGEGQFDITPDGDLVFAAGSDATIGRLVRLARGGTPERLPVPAGPFQRFDLSPDGRWLAATVPTPGRQELRLFDLRDSQALTWWSAEYVRHPVWSPRGDAILFSVRDSTRYSVLYGVPNSGRSPDTLYTTVDPMRYRDPVDFRNPGAIVLQDWEASSVTWVAGPTAWSEESPLVARDARFASVSPGGRFLAYQTVEGSRVMVTTFPAPGKRWQVASAGVEPIWLSATELLYRVGAAWYAVRIDPATGEATGPGTLWARDPRFSDTSGWSNRPTSDGRIIYLQGPEEVSVGYLRVMPRWTGQLRAAVDAAN